MGVTIKNNNQSLKMGYYNFYRLRTAIAKLYSDDFAKFFQDYSNGVYDDLSTREKLNTFKNVGLISENDNLVLDFLLESELEGKLSPKHCRHLYSHIKDYDDNTQYGKATRHVSFADFKNLVRECAVKHLTLNWS